MRCIAVLPPLRLQLLGLPHLVRFNPVLPPLRLQLLGLPHLVRCNPFCHGRKTNHRGAAGAVVAQFGAPWPSPQVSAPPRDMERDGIGRAPKHGRGGIRTHEALSAPTRSPGVRLQPLGHPSKQSRAPRAGSRCSDAQRPAPNQLPRQGSNLESLGPEPSVLPVTPRGIPQTSRRTTRKARGTRQSRKKERRNNLALAAGVGLRTVKR